MTCIENLKIYETILYTADSDGNPVEGTERPVMVMFNQTQISKEEVEELFNNDMWEYDNRVVPITPKQLAYLQDKEDNNDK